MSNDNIFKEKIKERYDKIAMFGNSDSCCTPSECYGGTDSSSEVSTGRSTQAIGYDATELAAIPQSSILAVGCGNLTNFAHINDGDVVVDLGSRTGNDAFLAANIVKEMGTVIGVDMTGEMLEKARQNAERHGYKNIEFRQSDIEKRILLRTIVWLQS